MMGIHQDKVYVGQPTRQVNCPMMHNNGRHGRERIVFETTQ